MKPICLSVFDIFKIGPGPSSSHTIAPMKAGYDFVEATSRLSPADLARAARIDVRLYGSLSATGEGHGTDRAVVAGLMGNPPETCPTELLDQLSLQEASAIREVKIGEKIFDMAVADVVFDNVQHDYPYSNTLVIRLLDEGGSVVFEREYYSVGGGFLEWKGWSPPERGMPVYEFGSAEELRVLLFKHQVSLHVALMENEKAITGKSESEIVDGLDFILDSMDKSVQRGLRAEGVLPGPIGLLRKASDLFAKSRVLGHTGGGFMSEVSAYALAVGEENAAGHTIVTAPTCGASGVLPSVYCTMKNRDGFPEHLLRRGLLAAGVVGFLCKHNASIAGAEVGCQGEVGVATAMGAAMLTYSLSQDAHFAFHAASVALEHQLGLTCDPVKGYVQIPCIERNAIGAVKAFNAEVIAMLQQPGTHKVHLDSTIQAMAETGRDMSHKYKETGLGGLAVCLPEC